MGFDYIASGHYARVIHPSPKLGDEPSVLKLSQDMVTELVMFDLFALIFLYILVVQVKFVLFS